MERRKARASGASSASTFAIWIVLALSWCGSLAAVDCNGNGVDDVVEVARGEAEDCNGNLSPDECETAPLDFRFFTTLEVGGMARMVEALDLDRDGRAELVAGHSDGLSILRETDEVGSFAAIDVELGSRVLTWRVGDLDADGETDFVARQESTFEVLWGVGGGVSGEPASVEAPPGVRAWAVGDVSGDGLADIVLADGGGIVVIESVAARMFAAPRTAPLDQPADELVLLDLGADDVLDVAALHENSETVSLFDGSLSSIGSLPTEVERPELLLATDFNADGVADLVVSGRSGRAVFFQRDGNMLEPPAVFESARGLTRSLAAGDVDKDGDIDLVGVFTLGDSVVVFLNGGDGVPITSQPLAGIDRPREVALGDFDGDDDLDVAVSSRSFDSVNILWNGDPRGNAIVAMTQERLIELPGPPHSIQTGDLDRDGATDVVVIDGANRIFLLKNDGQGNLIDPRVEDGTLLSVPGGRFWSLALGEFDGDGAPDIAVVDGSRFFQDFQNHVHVLLNGGVATFGEPTSYPVGANSSHVSTTDLDGDGRDEILTTSAGENALVVLFNRGDGTFDAARSVRVGSTPFASTGEDFDGDGDNDVVVSNWISGELSVLFNDGTGMFPTIVNYPVLSPLFVGTIDFDIDGDFDLLSVSSQRLILFENDGLGLFTQISSTPLVNAPRSFGAADVDGNGLPDVVSSSETGNAVTIVLNAGGGRFVPALDISVGKEPRFAATADFDRDGDVDVVSGNHGTHNVTVLHNQGIAAATEPFLHQICTSGDFDSLSRPVTQPVRGRMTKYIVPAVDDPALIPPVFQNVRAFPQHVQFLAANFPKSFPVQDYLELVDVRASRKYFSGALHQMETEAGFVYAFSVLSAVEQDPAEALTRQEVQMVHRQLTEVFSLGPLGYLADSPRAQEAAELWDDLGFTVFFDVVDDGLPVEPVPADATPRFVLEVPPETVACGVFVHSRSAQAAYELKSRVRFLAGKTELTTTADSFEAELFEEVLVGPQQEPAVAVGPGTFQVVRFAQGETTSYRFRYDQVFSFGGGRRFEVTLFNLTFRAQGGEPLGGALVLDEQFLTKELQLQGFEDFVVTYASCSYERLPLWEITIELGGELEGSGRIRLLERHQPPVPGETGPASLVFAELQLPDLRRAVASYWNLVYSSSRHNRSIEYWVVLEPPVVVAGLERPVRVVEVAAPDELFEVTAAVRYLDESFALLRDFPVLLHRRHAAPQETLLQRGDVLRDGVVNVTDVIAILGHLFRRESVPCVLAADANDDSRVNILDPIVLAQHLFAGGVPLPPPAGDCGVDPTPDLLPCAAKEPCGG